MARMIARSGARVDFIAMVRSSAPQISTQALRTHRVNPPFRPSSRDVGRQSGHCPPGPPNQHTTRWPLVFCMSWHADFGFRGAGLVVLWSGDARVISEQVSAGQFFSALRKGREKQVFLCLSLRFHETARFPLPAVRCCNTSCIALHRLSPPFTAFHRLSPPFAVVPLLRSQPAHPIQHRDGSVLRGPPRRDARARRCGVGDVSPNPRRLRWVHFGLRKAHVRG